MTLDDRAALLGISPREVVRRGIRWLHRELVSTEHARGRLAAWVASGGLDRAVDVRQELQYFGDPEPLPAVVEAFEAMAAPARAYVMQQAQVVVAGYSSLGWTGLNPTARHQVIVLSGAIPRAQLFRVALHEAAHVWLEATPTGLLRAVGGIDLQESARREGWWPTVEKAVGQKENRAEALARLWVRLSDTNRDSSSQTTAEEP